MSVICFDSIEFVIAKKMLKFAASGPGFADMKRRLRYTDAWREEEQWAKDEDETLAKAIDRVFWYAQVSNRMAYALQYQEEPGLFDKDDIEEAWKDCRSFRCTLAELRGALGHLNYNMITNDGRLFMPRQWEDFWNALRSWVTEQQADRADELLDGKGRALWTIREEVEKTKEQRAMEARI